MAKSDIISRLILRTEGWDKNLVNAEESAKKFSAGVTNVIGKVAGAIGLAMGATEAFNKTIHSSQALGDEFDTTISAAKMSVDAFFQSLATGDWAAFNGGLTTTIKKMKELAGLQDGFADAQLSMGFETREFEKEFARLEGIVDDKTRSVAERKNAFVEMQRAIKDYQNSVAGVSGGTEKMILSSLSARFGDKGFTIEDVKKFLSKYNYTTDFSNSKEARELADYMNKLSDLRAKQYTTTVVKTPMFGDVTTKTENTDVTAQIAAFKAQNAELEKMRILYDDNDAARKKMMEDYSYMLEIQQKGAEYFKRSLEKQSTIMELGKKGAGGGVSVAEVKSMGPTLEKMSGSLAGLAKIPELPVLNQIEMQAPKVLNMADALTMTGQAVYGLGAAFGEGAGAMVSYFANIVSGAGQAAAAILALIPVKKLEANANMQVAATGAAASVAATPFVGWMLAAGAVASVVAAMMAIPKFARGGVVPGASWSGDKVPALVNSGEMILTQGQQKRLFDIANGSGGGVRVSGDVRVSGKDLYISLRNYMNATGNRL